MNCVVAAARYFCFALVLGCAVSPAPLMAQQYQLNASLQANDGAGLSVGDSVTLVLRVSNAGPSGGAGQAAVSIPDVFQFSGESGCDQSSILPPSGGSFEFDWNSIPDSGGQLAPSQSVDCNVQLTLQSLPANPVSAFASIQPTTFDPNPGSASYQFNISTPVTTPKTDLRITATADPATLNQGQSLALHLVAQNAGAEDTPDAAVFVDPPAQLQVVSSNCGATFVGGREVWTIGEFAAGASATCDVQLKAVTSSAQPVSFPVTIASSADEITPADNFTIVNVTIKSVATADLAVALATTSTATSYALGDLVGLTLTVSLAAGTQAPTGISANLRLPSKDLLSNVNAPCGQFDAAGTTLTWNVTNLAAGQPQKCTISATIASVDKPIAVSADVASAQTDPNLGNNTTSLVVQTYEPPAQLFSTPTPTTQDSTNVALTVDGRAGVFESKQTNLVANNSNPSGQDIFRFSGGNLVRENVDNTGKQLVGVSSLPTISANGQVVAFQYSAQTVSASPQGGSQPKGASDQLGIIIGGSSGQPKHQLDVATNGAQPNGVSGSTSVSADGHQLVFCSSASNLVGNDTNNTKDVFLVDPLNPAQATRRVSLDSNGNQLPGDSCEPKISPDGSTVVFTTSAPNLFGNAARQVVSKNLSSGVLQLISAASTGTNQGGNADSSQPVPNSNARAVAFVSKASNLDSLAAAPAGGAEVFVSAPTSNNDNAPRSVSRARNAGSPAPNGPSQSPAISCDGSTVAFQSSATNLPGATSDQQGMFVYSPQSSQVMAAGNRGQVTNTNPSISCDGTALGFDSNQSQPSTSSNNQNVYSQTTPALTLDASFSGQWSDPTVKDGRYGLVVEVTDSVGSRAMVLTWYVFKDGKPTWLLGVSDAPQTGTGADAGMIVVNVPNVYTATGKSFPLGGSSATFALWGSIKLKFASKDTGTMSWTTTYPGFNSGSMQLSHFALEDFPVVDPTAAKVRACHAGGWADSTENGTGFELGITTIGATRLLTADWFAFDPSGKPVWLAGTGVIDSSNKVTATMYLISGNGAQFPPLFNAKDVVLPVWGTVTFTFTDNEHIGAQWNSTVAGYGSGQRSLTRAYTLTGRLCQ